MSQEAHWLAQPLPRDNLTMSLSAAFWLQLAMKVTF